ncbi:hypothetical protein [Halogeometricum borinquense]|uniref:hypothetical protein n=1 Tax=Halogeometricum borinquense TaxID=60847 RepID=UPI003424BC8F
MSPKETSTTRRAVLKTIGGGAVATGGFAGVAAAADDDVMTKLGGGIHATLSPGDGDPDMDEDEFREYVEKMAERYGDAGVFGTGDPTYDGFITATADNIDTSTERGAYEGDYEVDSVAATYRVEGDSANDSGESNSESDQTRYRHFMWTAVDNGDLTYTAGLGSFNIITEPLRTEYLQIGVETAGKVANPMITDTISADNSSTVAVEFGSGDASFKLPSGRVTTNPSGEILSDQRPDSEYSLEWEGLADGVRSIATTVETVHDEDEPSIEFTTEYNFGYESLL